MVGFVAKDRKGAIELFGEYNADKLVGEGHARERYLGVCTLVDRLSEAEGPSHNKEQSFDSARHAFL